MSSPIHAFSLSPDRERGKAAVLHQYLGSRGRVLCVARVRSEGTLNPRAERRAAFMICIPQPTPQKERHSQTQRSKYSKLDMIAYMRGRPLHVRSAL